MITVALSTVIEADRSRVWRALVDPAELAAWDERIVAPAGDVGDGPLRPGSRLRWRCRVARTGGVEMLRADETLELVAPERLRTRIVLGTLRVERAWRLASRPGTPPRTVLAVTLRAENRVPVFGTVIDRFRVRQWATELADETLRGLRTWCEAPAPREPVEPVRPETAAADRR